MDSQCEKESNLNPNFEQNKFHVETFAGDNFLRGEGSAGVQEQAGHQMHNGEWIFGFTKSKCTTVSGFLDSPNPYAHRLLDFWISEN